VEKEEEEAEEEDEDRRNGERRRRRRRRKRRRRRGRRRKRRRSRRMRRKKNRRRRFTIDVNRVLAINNPPCLIGHHGHPRQQHDLLKGRRRRAAGRSAPGKGRQPLALLLQPRLALALRHHLLAHRAQLAGVGEL
jgi:hypothetical protein